MTRWLSDRLLGISTARKEKVHRLDLPPEVARHAHDYEPSPYGVLPDALLTVPLEPAETTFVDVGAGKGRVLAEALHHGFRRVIGLEASARLVQLAKDNLQHVDGVERADILEVDATTWSLPDEPLVVYLFNPFGHAAHDRFATQVELRIRRCEAPLWVVHHQPEHRDAWAGAPSLRCVEFEARRMILRSPERDWGEGHPIVE